MITPKIFMSVEFVKSITNLKDQPKSKLPEIAFAGRSNVGKSSLLNSIFNRKNLVKTSSTPGKTQQINYFIVSNKFYFVDLPGYGYARIPLNIKKSWQGMMENYLLKNKYLKRIYLLIDSRHDLQNSDREMIDWLDQSAINFTIILSKYDKLKKGDYHKVINYFTGITGCSNILPFSVKSDKFINSLKYQIINDLA
jgi:GTP-binding protein